MINDNAPHDLDPFARGDECRPSPASGVVQTPDDLADGMVVHGMLSLFQPGETARVQQRVDRAIATIRRMNDSRRLFWRTRLAWVGGSVGIAAAIALAVFYVPADSDSSAYAALESIRGSTRQGGRSYAVRFEMDGTGGPIAQAKQLENDKKPLIDNEKKPHRMAELALGSGGRWTIVISPPNMPRIRGAFGFDGTTYWTVDPDGSIRTAQTVKELRVPIFISVLESGTSDGDEDLELFTLDSMLSKLDREYTISFDRTGDRTNRDGRLITVVTAERTGKRESRAPNTVRIIADSNTFEVLRASWQWTELPPANREQTAPQASPEGKPRIKRIFLELIETPPHGDEWFTAQTHAKSMADMPRPMGPPRPGAHQNSKPIRE